MVPDFGERKVESLSSKRCVICVMSQNALRCRDCRRGAWCSGTWSSVPRITAFAIVMTVGLLYRSVQAQDIAGTWQGAMQAGKEQRIVVKIAKDAGAGWQARVFNLDSNRAYEGRATTQMSLQGTEVRF